MRFKKWIALLIMVVAGSFLTGREAFAVEKFKVVATTSLFADLIGQIAGKKAEVYYIASPSQDIHFISPNPKDVVKTKKADVFVHAGLDLEAWRGPFLDAVGKMEFMPGGKRAIDLSQGIALLEIPSSLSRTQGDIHAFGNPHYWTDPLNVKIMVRHIAEALAQIYPEDQDFFKKNADEFGRKIDEKMRDWSKRLEPYKGTSVVTYHNDLPYFIERFGLVVAGHLEPKPGIPPTAKHLADLMHGMKEKKVKVIIKDSYQEDRTPGRLAEQTGAKVLVLAQSVGQNKEGHDYFSMMEYNIGTLEKAFHEKGRSR